MLPALNADRIQYIFSNMDDTVCLTGRRGELLYANTAAEKLFGIHADGETKLWRAIPYVEENDALIQLFIDALEEKKKSVRSLVEYVNRDGEHFQLHVSLTCEAEETGIILVVISDLTHLIKVHSAFARYTSPEIADYILTAPDGEKQGGQSREASILMSDLRGFTAMSTHLTAQELITALNHYFEVVSAVIQRYGGTIIEFLGDGIFTVFGAPGDLPNHASAAVACAVEMQNAMSGINAWNRENGFPEMAMGIGICSGTIVAGNIGSDKKMKYGCMGETVNLAGRLEALSIGGQIHIPESTRSLIPEELTILGKSSFIPKGGRAEMTVYNIAGIGDLQLTDSDGCPPEWKTLRQAVPVFYQILEGKAVCPEEYPGEILKISTDGKYGILSVREGELKQRQDLKIRAGGLDIYAKVTGREADGYKIGFTMKPEGFPELFGQS